MEDIRSSGEEEKNDDHAISVILPKITSGPGNVCLTWHVNGMFCQFIPNLLHWLDSCRSHIVNKIETKSISRR